MAPNCWEWTGEGELPEDATEPDVDTAELQNGHVERDTGITFGEPSILKFSVELYGTLFVSKKLNLRQL